MGLKFSLVNKLCWCYLVGLLSASIYSYHQDRNCSGMICRGDFPAFYSAAVLALSNQNIYDQDLQKKIQNHFWPSLNGRFLYFSYPPYVASILSPMALLKPIHAKFIFIILSIVSILLSVRLLSIEYDLNYLHALIGLVSFLPSVVGIISGQNFALSFLLLTLIYVAIERKQEYLSGFIVGLWIFKPHFALIAFIGLLGCRLWKSALLASSIYLSVYFITSLKYGIYWPINWLKIVNFFYINDLENNGHQMVSLISYFEVLDLAVIGKILSFSLILIFIFYCMKTGVYSFRYMLPAVIVLCSPHTMYYDLPLCFMPLFTFKNKIKLIPVISISFLFSVLFIIRASLSVTPLILLPLIILLFNDSSSLRKVNTR